jgi:mannosyltransferase
VKTAERWPALAVGLLTVVAFALRLSGMGDSIFGDEVLLLDRVHDRGLGAMLDQVHDLESTPPFHFVLAWVGTKVASDPVTGIRLPSLLLGPATVPLVYLAGRRTVGAAAGVVGAAVAALSPFAIFYGTEGRAYATLAFLVAASMVCLLRAVDGGGRGWWTAWALTCALVLYTHYTGVYVLVAEGIWALVAHPERRRAILLAGGGVVLAYLPWIPSFITQSDDNASNRIDSFAPLSLDSFLRDWLKSVDGHPFIALRDLPGRPAEVVFCAVVGLALVVALVRLLRDRDRPRDGLVLVVAVALATPAGLLLYSLVAKSIVLPRNMSASLPAVALLVGWALTGVGRRATPVAVALALGALGVGTVAMMDDDNRRPPFEGAAAFIDARAQPGDGVIDFFYNPMSKASGRDLVVNLKGRYRLFRAGDDDDAAWRRAEASGGRVFLVVPQVGPLRGVPRRSGPGGRFPLRDHRIYPGFIPIGVFEYRM